MATLKTPPRGSIGYMHCTIAEAGKSACNYATVHAPAAEQQSIQALSCYLAFSIKCIIGA